jgi:hypothetical protein
MFSKRLGFSILTVESPFWNIFLVTQDLKTKFFSWLCKSINTLVGSLSLSLLGITWYISHHYQPLQTEHQDCLCFLAIVITIFTLFLLVTFITYFSLLCEFISSTDNKQCNSKTASLTIDSILTLNFSKKLVYTHYCMSFFFFFSWDRVSLCSPSWPWTHGYLTLASQILGLQECIIMSNCLKREVNFGPHKEYSKLQVSHRNSIQACAISEPLTST